MKKKFTISAVLSLITLIGFSQCPTSYTRNNGNGVGTCGTGAQIKMYFATMPAIAPTIDSVYSNGAKLNVTYSAPDTSKYKTGGYISYCFGGNLPPIGALQVYFNTGNTKDSFKTVCTVPPGSGPEAGPTPVVLSSFNAERNGTSVNLTWKTEQELNSRGYEIQRSSDNINFETIGIVASKSANSSIAQYYSFTDNTNSFSEMSYYRLKMVDLDETFTYSYVRTVKGSGFKSEIVLFPNPASSNEKITIGNISEPSKIMVFDNTGRLIQQTSTTSTSIDLNNLQKGNYFVKILGQQSGSSTVKKLSVIN